MCESPEGQKADWRLPGAEWGALADAVSFQGDGDVLELHAQKAEQSMDSGGKI